MSDRLVVCLHRYLAKVYIMVVKQDDPRWIKWGFQIGVILIAGIWLSSGEFIEARPSPRKLRQQGKVAPTDAPDEVGALVEEVKKLNAAVMELNSRVARLQETARTSPPANQSAPKPQPVVAPEQPKSRPSVVSVASPNSNSNPNKKPSRAPMPIYEKPAMAYFKEMTDQIQDGINEASDPKAAAEMTKSLERFRGLAKGSYQEMKTTEPEVFFVGMYEPLTGKDFKNSPAKVRVTYTGGPVILALSSYHSVIWDVEVAEGVQLESVVVSGYEPQEIRGVLETVPVTNTSRGAKNASSGPYFQAYDKNDDSYGSALRAVKQTTGYEVSTFQGAYRYPDQPFVVGPDHQDWRYQHLIAQMRDLHAQALRPRVERTIAQAKELKFSALYLQNGNHFGAGATASFGSFTPNGPILSTMKKMSERLNRATSNATGDVLYAQSGHDPFFRILPDGKRENLKFPIDLPSVSWPTGLTFDTKRNRVLNVTVGGEGFLYAYDVGAEKWSVVTSMNNRDCYALGYEPKLDRIFCIAKNLGSGKTELVRMTNEGIVDKSLPLALPSGALGEHSGCQLLAANGKLILIGCAPIRIAEEHFATLTHSYVIDPETAAIEFTSELQPQTDESVK